jgi:hypothetical protein
MGTIYTDEVVPMPARRRAQLAVRVLFVATPDAEREQRRVLGEIGKALADQLIEKARAEVAASLGVRPEEIARERGVLDEETRRQLDDADWLLRRDHGPTKA